MRVRAAIFILAMAAAGEANASSFVTLGAETPSEAPSIVVIGAVEPAVVTKSMVVLGDPDPAPTVQLASTNTGSQQGARNRTVISVSVIAMGEPAPAISDEKVAAIAHEPAKRHKRPHAMPMVIRGGLVGDAFGRSGPAASPEESAEPVLSSSQPGAANRPRPPAQPARPEPEPAVEGTPVFTE